MKGLNLELEIFNLIFRQLSSKVILRLERGNQIAQ